MGWKRRAAEEWQRWWRSSWLPGVGVGGVRGGGVRGVGWASWRRAILSTVVSMILIYWSHRTLKMQHHHYCSSDMFRIIMYSQSNMCSHIATLINIVEMACGHFAMHFSSSLFGYLNAALFGRSAGKAAATSTFFKQVAGLLNQRA